MPQTPLVPMSRFLLLLAALTVPLGACGDKESAGGGGGDGGSTDEGPQPAALAELSSGECPDLSTGGLVSFLSSGEERNVMVLYPEDPEPGLPVVFFFHGLMDATTPPAEYFASALDLQDLADETNTIIVLPESKLMSLMGFSFYMWDAMESGDEDIVLYDDLRTCMAQELDADMTRVAAMGFSGGALFTGSIARERSDTLAVMISMSGGADAEVPTFDSPAARYDTYTNTTLPALLISGGEDDVWPGGGLVVIDFDEATDTLEDHLVGDGHFVVRCRHDSGHTITQSLLNLSEDWAVSHTFGEASPYVGATDLPEGCEIAE
jgi:predicted esterase